MHPNADFNGDTAESYGKTAEINPSLICAEANLYFIDTVRESKVIKMIGFRIAGSFRDVRQGMQPFNVEVAAENEDAAREQIVSTLGSRHKVKRWEIKIDSINQIPNDEIVDHTVRYKVTGE